MRHIISCVICLVFASTSLAGGLQCLNDPHYSTLGELGKEIGLKAEVGSIFGAKALVPANLQSHVQSVEMFLNNFTVRKLRKTNRRNVSAEEGANLSQSLTTSAANFFFLVLEGKEKLSLLVWSRLMNPEANAQVAMRLIEAQQSQSPADEMAFGKLRPFAIGSGSFIVRQTAEGPATLRIVLSRISNMSKDLQASFAREGDQSHSNLWYWASGAKILPLISDEILTGFQNRLPADTKVTIYDDGKPRS